MNGFRENGHGRMDERTDVRRRIQRSIDSVERPKKGFSSLRSTKNFFSQIHPYIPPWNNFSNFLAKKFFDQFSKILTYDVIFTQKMRPFGKFSPKMTYFDQIDTINDYFDQS